MTDHGEDKAAACRIVRTADTCGGKARIDGTRISVYFVWGFMTLDPEPYDMAEFLEMYPDLTEDQVKAALAYAAEHLEEMQAELKRALSHDNLAFPPGD